MTGVDSLALESLIMGAVGGIAGLVCAFPKETVAIYKLQKLREMDIKDFQENGSLFH